MNYPFFFTICFASFLIISCKNNKEADTSAQASAVATYVQDTLQKHRIDSIVDVINKATWEERIINKISFPVYNENDSIMYWHRDGKLSVIEATMIYPDKMVWPTFYLLNEEPIYIRYRFVVPNYPSFVMETLIYLNGKDIVYCLERKMDLKPGELPGLLKDKDFMTCSGSHEKVHKLYSEYWPGLKTFVKDHLSK